MAVKKAKAKKALVKKPKAKKAVKKKASKKKNIVKKIAKTSEEKKAFTTKLIFFLLFGAIIITSLIINLKPADWTNDRQFHPDERWIISSAVPGIQKWGEKPIGLQYGSLPLYMLAMQKNVVNWMNKKHMIKDMNKARIGGARAFSGIISTLTVVMIFLTALLLFGPKIALLSSLLLTFTVLNIHAAHFFTVDTFMTLFVVCTVYFSARIYKYGNLRNYIFAGIFYAAAIASKSAALPAAAVIAIAHFMYFFTIKGKTRAKKVDRINSWINVAWLLLVVCVAFFVFMPHAILDWKKFSSDQNYQSRILVTGEGDVPYNRQYLDTPAYIFYIDNLVKYTMGIPYGAVAILAFVFYILMFIMSIRKGKLPDKEMLLLLAWMVPYFLIVGQSFAKFNRYMIPFTPFLAIITAKFIYDLHRYIKQKTIVNIIKYVVIGGAMFYGLAFLNIYNQPHPWIESSEWIYKNVPIVDNSVNPPKRTQILNEMWGDDLPTYGKGGHPGQYQNVKWAVQEPDSPNKMQELSTKLSQVDYVVMADKRAKGTYMRLPGMYPINYFYFSTMLSNPEKLGYKLVHDFTTYPKLFGIELKDDKSDESFKLYDHPHVHIFKNEKYLPAEEMKAILTTGSNEITAQYGVWKKDGKRINKKADSDTAGAVVAKPNPNIGQLKDKVVSIMSNVASFKMDASVFIWYILIQLLAFIIWPLHFILFRNLNDKGYGLAKITGLFVFAWLNWMLVSAGVWKFYQVNLWVLMLVLFGISVFVYRKKSSMIRAFTAEKKRHMMITEIVFLSAYIFFVVIKLWCPDIHNVMGHGYNGGGEPMGMAYLSGIFNDVKFPPHDPWLSGFTLNYYYWGQLMLATASKVLGILPRISYNLSLSLLFAFSFVGAFTLMYNMTGKYRYGILSGFMLAMAGNFHTLVYTLEKIINASNIMQAFNNIGRFQFIWDPTRIYPNPAITELPFFSYLYGDLHAHNIVIPITVVAIALLFNFFKAANKTTNVFNNFGPDKKQIAVNLGVFALVLGSMMTINTWNFPPVLLMYAITFGYAGYLLYYNMKIDKKTQFADKALTMTKVIGVPLVITVVLLVVAYILFMPFHANFQSPYKSVAKFISKGERATVMQMFKYFSVFFIIIWAYMMFAWSKGFDAFIKETGVFKIKRVTIDKLSRHFSKVSDKIFDNGELTFKFIGSIVILLGALVLSMFVQPTFGLLFLMIVTVIWMLLKSTSTEERFSLLGVFLALGIVAGVELVFIADGRMNTVFKFYMVAWTFLAVSVPYLLFETIKGMKKLFTNDRKNTLFTALAALAFLSIITALKFIDAREGSDFFSVFFILTVIFSSVAMFVMKNKIGKYIFTGALVFIFIPAILYPIGGAFIKMNICSLGFKVKPHIDGLAYMKNINQRANSRWDFDKYDYQAIEWINNEMATIETILEAPGERMYSGLSRISVFTGMPTLVGWGYQVGQQSGRGTQVSDRNRSGALMYRMEDADQTEKLLQSYNVRYVYVGSIEEKLYPKRLGKFNTIGTKIYENEKSMIYEIKSMEQK